jgi:hypothetical protein
MVSMVLVVSGSKLTVLRGVSRREATGARDVSCRGFLGSGIANCDLEGLLERLVECGDPSDHCVSTRLSNLAGLQYSEGVAKKGDGEQETRGQPEALLSLL